MTERTTPFYFTLLELKESPWKIKERMDYIDCVDFLQRYKGKHIRDIRTLILTRMATLKEQQRDVVRQRLIEEKRIIAATALTKLKIQVETIKETVEIALQRNKKTPEKWMILKQIYGRIIGNTIYDMPSIWTGLTSVNALNGESSTKEHYWPRSAVTGRLLLDTAKKLDQAGVKIPFSVYVHYCFERCHVNKVTRKENSKILSPFQKYHTFKGPVQSYNSAGIFLVQEVERKIPSVWLELLTMYKVIPVNIPKFLLVDK